MLNREPQTMRVSAAPLFLTAETKESELPVEQR